MSHPFLILLASVALTAGSTLFAAEPVATPAQTTMNAMCPMCGKMVGDHPAMVPMSVGEGKTAKNFSIACDTMDCANTFMKDPEPVIKARIGREAPGPKTQYK